MLTSYMLILFRKIKRLLNPGSSDWLYRDGPFSRFFGLDRGNAIDRQFIESFLKMEESVITGDVLEIGCDEYTYRYGTNLSNTVIFAGQASSSRSKCFPGGDLTNSDTFPAEKMQFDCIIATNVLNFIFEKEKAIRGLSQLIKPSGGFVLVTVAGLCQISRFDYERWGDYWRFTDTSIRKLFGQYFENVEVKTHGNAPLAAAMIMGLAKEDVPLKLFDTEDPDFQIVISVKAWMPKKSSCEN